MLINELAKISGLSKDTIRFYEKNGLLGKDDIERKNNNYRNYNQSSLNRLQVICDLKEFGFSLPEINELVQLYENKSPCVENIDKIELKINILDEKIKNLQKYKTKLTEALTDCKKDCKKHCHIDKTLSLLSDQKGQF